MQQPAPVPPTQVRRPWRATLRTVFAATVAFAAMWALIVEAAGVDSTEPYIALSLTVTGAITRIMALPAVEVWLAKFLPFLAAEPKSEMMVE